MNKVTHNIRLVKDYFQKYHGKYKRETKKNQIKLKYHTAKLSAASKRLHQHVKVKFKKEPPQVGLRSGQ